MSERSKLYEVLGRIPHLDDQLGKVVKVAFANCSDEENTEILNLIIKLHIKRWPRDNVPEDLRHEKRDLKIHDELVAKLGPPHRSTARQNDIPAGRRNPRCEPCAHRLPCIHEKDHRKHNENKANCIC